MMISGHPENAEITVGMEVFLAKILKIMMSAMMTIYVIKTGKKTILFERPLSQVNVMLFE